MSPRAHEEDDESTGAGGAPVVPGSPGDDLLATPSPMAGLPLGAAFGTTVHSVLELADRDAPDLPGELRRACAVALARSPNSSITVEDLTTGLLPVFDTPLGPLAGDRTLREMPMDDQLAELSFEYALAGGEATNAEISVGMLAGLLHRHLPASDPLAGYGDQLDEPGLADQALRGFLTGSIDAVLRIADRDGEPALPRRGLQDQLARGLGHRGADRGRLHAGSARGSDDRRPLPAAGVALLRCAAPAAALATARLRSGATPRRHPLPVRPWHGRAGDAAGGRSALRRLRLASAGRAGAGAVGPAGRARP